MPELPDITIYVEALESRIRGQCLKRIQVRSPFLLRTVVPPLDSITGRRVTEIRCMGKRIVFGFERDSWLVLHLMIAGRLHWLNVAESPRKNCLASFEFEGGWLTLTEAGTKRRASLHLFDSKVTLAAHDPGGFEVMGSSVEEFAKVLTRSNHTLKRALTDPRLFSGMGNAYSDEILHRARLSPVALTQKLTKPQVAQLHAACVETMREWITRLREEAAGNFREKVIAFRPEMAVHGKFGQPCPVCGAKVQRIRYASNETNYCPKCQTGGRLLADRSLSLLLKKDWPKTPEELEELRKP